MDAQANNNKKTNFTTLSGNVTITSVDYYIPAWQAVTKLRLAIYNSSGTVIASSSTTTSQTASSTAIKITNTFNYTISTAGNYSFGVLSGIGNIGSDNPTFPIAESTGTINITGVSVPSFRCYNNIQFSTNNGSSSAPTPSTSEIGSTVYTVTQTVNGCISPPATITVNVTGLNISQTPTSGLIADYNFSGNALDETGSNNGNLQNNPTLTSDLFNIANKAYAFNGSTQYVSTSNSYTNPSNFTISIWFKTNTITGGKLIGFGNSQFDQSGNYDRHIYMNNAGQVYFGVYTGTVWTVNTPLSYNDNNWHNVTATLSGTSGMALYIDGEIVDQNASVTSAENFTGFWKIVGDNMNGWTSQPSSYYFNGILDDASIYHRAISAAEVNTLYSSPDGAGNNGPLYAGSPLNLTAKTVASFHKGLSSFVQPQYFYFASLTFFILTMVLIAKTYRILYVKRKKHKLKINIRQALEEWITETIISESNADFAVPEELSFIFKKTESRQMVIDELLRNKTNFTGIVSDNIIKLYYQLALNVDSINKIDGAKPGIQCQGIHELCVMEQKDQLLKVYRLTNSKSKDVRVEAQTAVLRWYGFRGLRFLDVLTFPITEFQQLRLLELLRQLQFDEIPKLEQWLTSANETVVNFALKITEHYKQSHVIHITEQCLSHKSEEVRIQAVKTLVAIANTSTAMLLTTAYYKESFTNRLNILKQLPAIATDEQQDFLVVQLTEGNEYLKLAAAKVLAQCTNEGMEILEAKGYDDPTEYQDIYLHIKSELAR